MKARMNPQAESETREGRTTPSGRPSPEIDSGDGEVDELVRIKMPAKGNRKAGTSYIIIYRERIDRIESTACARVNSTAV